MIIEPILLKLIFLIVITIQKTSERPVIPPADISADIQV